MRARFDVRLLKLSTSEHVWVFRIHHVIFDGCSACLMFQNRSDRDAVVLEVGTRRPEDDCVFYPDIDLQVLKGRAGYAHRNGELYVGRKPGNPATGK